MTSLFVITHYKDALKDIINPALTGTENVLNSVNRTASVQRVVLTSSIVATFAMPLISRKPQIMSLMKATGTAVMQNISPILILKSLLKKKRGKCKLNNPFGIWSV